MIDDRLNHLWFPYTQMKTMVPPLHAVATEGSRIRLADGRELIDGVASWWTACHGYNHPYLAEAAARQMKAMPHIMFGGIVHDPAMQLAGRLAKITPGDLERVFFADSGSIAVEVALKMAVQYWINKGERGKTRFVHFRHGYHGDTMGCMAVCDPEEGMHAHFGKWLPRHMMAELPRDEKETADFDNLLQKNRDHIAAVIIEPLVQGAGGMKFHAPEVLKRVADLCAKHHLLLIADEIFTGFGRTGTMFACEQAAIVPDIMCVGKALTGGTMTLAATLARGHVFDAFWSEDPKAALMHGPTYMANPLACAVANASLDLFEMEPRLQQVHAIEAALREGLESCRGLPGVIDVRTKGAIGVVQLKTLHDNAWLKAALAAEGVWIRPFSDIVYLTPAMTISPPELAQLTRALCKVVRAWSTKF